MISIRLPLPVIGQKKDNPELNTTDRLTPDEKADKNQETLRKKKEARQKRLDEINSGRAPDNQRELSPLWASLEKFYDAKAEIEGLGPLPFRPLGFKEEELQTFQQVQTTTRGPEDADGILYGSEIKQHIADCYYMSSLLGCLFARPDFLSHRIRPVSEEEKAELPKDKNWFKVDKYVRRLFMFFKRTVTVSDTFPSGRSQPTDGVVTPDVLLGLLMQKASALFQGGYDAHAWGYTAEALSSLTGNRAVKDLVFLKDPERLWKRTVSRLDRGMVTLVNIFNSASWLKNTLGKILPEWATTALEKWADERSPSKFGLTDKHCYVVVGYSTEKVEEIVERNGENVVEEKMVRYLHLVDPRRSKKDALDTDDSLPANLKNANIIKKPFDEVVKAATSFVSSRLNLPPIQEPEKVG